MRAKFVLSLLIGFSLTLITCSSDTPTESEDTLGPLAIADLTIVGEVVTSATLTWTAPADDHASGKVLLYGIRYATDSLVLTDWTEATVVANPPEVGEPGTTEQIEISPLAYDQVYYFGIKSIDNSGNISELSNISWQAHSETPEVILTSPSMGMAVADLVDITALARDDKGVNHVAFYVDGDLLSVDYGAPYTAQWDAHLENYGTVHSIYAEVADTDNNLVHSDTHSVNIDRDAAKPATPEIIEMNQSDSGVVMIWRACQANDFDHYEVRWDTITTIIALRNHTEIYDQFDTTFFIELELDFTDYYFYVSTYDEFANWDRTDTMITTGDKFPSISEVTHLVKIDESRSRVIWDGAQSTDFLEYNLYRSTDAIFDTGDLLLYNTTEIDDTSYVDTLVIGTQAYYFLLVSDQTGNTTMSSPFGTHLIEVIGSDWALQFDGNNDHVRISPRLDWQGSWERTFEMWVYPDPNQYVFNNIVISGGEHFWELDVTTGAKHHYYSGDCHVEVDSAMIPPQTWTHVAIVTSWRYDYLKFYVNGDLVDSLNCSAPPNPTTLVFIGSRADDNSYNFKGMVDEIRIWNYNRSNEEIKTNYNVTISSIPEGLIGYWPLEEGYGSMTWMGAGPDAILGKEAGQDKFDPTWVRLGH